MRPRRQIMAALPVILFAVLGIVLWKGLAGDPAQLPSTLLGKPVPQFALQPITGSSWPGVQSQDLRGTKVTLVNIFASWCQPCRTEHPILMELAKRDDIQIFGIDNKDDPANAIRFLNTLGNPYTAIGADTDGRVTIEWGGYGVPETFIVDAAGIIRYKFIGPLSPQTLADTLLPEIEKAKAPVNPDQF